MNKNCRISIFGQHVKINKILVDFQFNILKLVICEHVNNQSYFKKHKYPV